MRVYINRDKVFGPWGGGAHAINNFHDLAHEFGISIKNSDPNVMFLFGLDADQNHISAEAALHYKQHVDNNCKIVMRVNECDIRKGTKHVDSRLLGLSKQIDGTIFVSNWLKQYFLDKGWACSNNIVIYNGCDQNIFKPNVKLNNGKINIVTHHWSDNKFKGEDVHLWLDDYVSKNTEFTYTYIGRSGVYLHNTRVVAPLHGKELGAELGKYDVYVSASHADPGPNHVIEALACGLPTYVCSTGGGSVEFAGVEHTFKDVKMLKDILESKSYKTNSVWYPQPWHNSIKQYVDFLKVVYGKQI